MAPTRFSTPYSIDGVWTISKQLVYFFNDWDTASVFAEMIELSHAYANENGWFEAEYESISDTLKMPVPQVKKCIKNILSHDFLRLEICGSPPVRLYSIDSDIFLGRIRGTR